MDIHIEPTSVSFEIVKVTYEIITLVPNEYCEITAYLTESDGNRVKRYNLKLENPEYSQWGEDDTFLIDWICSQCGLNKKPVVLPDENIVLPDENIVLPDEIPITESVTQT